MYLFEMTSIAVTENIMLFVFLARNIWDFRVVFCVDLQEQKMKNFVDN